jgi:hypothetical protein
MVVGRMLWNMEAYTKPLKKRIQSVGIGHHAGSLSRRCCRRTRKEFYDSRKLESQVFRHIPEAMLQKCCLESENQHQTSALQYNYVNKYLVLTTLSMSDKAVPSLLNSREGWHNLP